MSELQEFLSDEPAEAQTTEESQTEATAETETSETVAAEDGDGSPSESETLANDDPAPEKEEESTIPIAALLDERDKRQRAQKDRDDLQAKLDALNKAEVVIPDVLDDQAGFVEQVDKRINTAVMNTRIELSQEMMRTLHDDYDDAESKFLTMAGDNPSLTVQMMEATSPAKFVYDTVKKAEKLEKLDNVEEMEASMRVELEAKIRAELEAKIKGELDGVQDKIDSLTPSIAGQRAAGGNTPVPVTIPDPLETTFKR